jgi:hypothetical protein
MCVRRCQPSRLRMVLVQRMLLQGTTCMRAS